MRKILVAYDASEPATRALAQAVELAKAFGASISVVSVVVPHPGREFADQQEDRDRYTARLADARSYLQAHGLDATVLEPSGDPAETIERIIEEAAFDTVVLGSRGLGGPARFLLGSVSEHIATHAKATVLIVR
jgi:nucleotide-binding universal stress UspA family protein